MVHSILNPVDLYNKELIMPADPLENKSLITDINLSSIYMDISNALIV